MKKKIISIVTIVLVLAVMVGCMSTLVGCNKVFEKGLEEKADLSEIKIGLICLHDKTSTYDKNFITAMEEVQAELGLKKKQVVIVTGVPEGDECYQQACKLADKGCNIIIADSFGHEDYMMKAAKEYPTVLFAHATGTQAHTANLDNFVNAFASIYEGRYLAGVVAGKKLAAMIAANPATSTKVGYIGAFTYAEVISGFTAWYLGVRSVVPTATMDVTFTGSWFDIDAENTAAKKLINAGCSLISQHADSMGAPNACEENNVPNVSYNGSTAEQCPNTFLVSSRINWAPYYKYLIKCRQEGTKPMKDYVGTIENGGVELTGLGTACAEGTQKAIDDAKAALKAGKQVFATDDTKAIVAGNYIKNTDGTPVTSYIADVDSDATFTPDTEVVSNGYLHESEKRSAPYFALKIQGIKWLDEGPKANA